MGIKRKKLVPTYKSGFTLLELLVTLTIVGILTAISYPFYTQHLVKAQRRRAEITLMHLASRLEEYHSLLGTYENANFSTLNVTKSTKDNSYRLEIQNATENQYLISAIPQSTQEKNDTLCGILSINEIGHRFVSGNGVLDECW